MAVSFFSRDSTNMDAMNLCLLPDGNGDEGGVGEGSG